MRGEFETIAACFAGLASSAPGAFGLVDDGALLEVPAGRQLVVTMDTLVAGVHFLAEDPAASIAKKLLRVNLSDLAAMGAKPESYALSAAFAPGTRDDWVDAFAGGLREDQAAFSLGLLGGDTVSTPGPATFTACAFGSVPKGKILRREGARVGDAIYVSGTLGDGAFGLDACRGALNWLDPSLLRYLQDRYRLPDPRVGLGQELLGVASACLDVSDGLVADLGHLARASGLGAKVESSALPLSEAASQVIAEDAALFAKVFAGGDDYELLFTAAEDAAGALKALSRRLGVPITRIGQIVEQPGVRLLDRDGADLPAAEGGWTHF